MLISFPFAYLVGSACLDAWSRATGRRTFYRTASHMNALGLGSAVLAAVPGLMDYVNVVPPKSSAKERATKHMFANLSALGLFALARVARRKSDSRPHAVAVAAEMAGAGLMGMAGWLGGTLVYRNQIGVDHRYADAGKWQMEPVPAHAIGDGSVDAGADGELQAGQMKLLRIAGKRIVLARTDEGYAAFDDRCTHKGGPLADGALVCGTVQCPWHGSQFETDTGAVKHGPAEERIATYPVSRREGRVWISVGATG
jgi:nitrite reductase/ring-hydroxylating ferredoxin subunit/uncharacterized membrane protein